MMAFLKQAFKMLVYVSITLTTLKLANSGTDDSWITPTIPLWIIVILLASFVLIAGFSMVYVVCKSIATSELDWNAIFLTLWMVLNIGGFTSGLGLFIYLGPKVATSSLAYKDCFTHLITYSSIVFGLIILTALRYKSL